MIESQSPRACARTVVSGAAPRILGVVAALACATAPRPAEASTIVFSNLQGGTGFSVAAVAVSDETSATGNDLDRAGTFVPTADYTLDSVTVAFAWNGGNDSFELWLMTDSAGQPGSLIETLVFDNVPSGTGSLLTQTSSLHPLLSAGSRYWLVASALGNGFFGWNVVSNSDPGPTARRQDEGPWTISGVNVPAFSVTGTPLVAPVPEPATLSLVAFGLAGMGVRRWRRKVLPAALLLLITHAVPADAAPILQVNSSGLLTGALGVEIDGAFYDVAFVEGSCIADFNGCDEASDFTFTTETAATAAAQALLDQVFVDGPLGAFDTNHTLTAGCTDPNQCVTFVPYLLALPRVTVVGAANRFSGDLEVPGSINVVIPQANLMSATYARFTLGAPPPTPVPEPASMTLLALGLAGVGAARRRTRHAK